MRFQPERCIPLLTFSLLSNIEATYGTTVLPDLRESFATEPPGTFEQRVTIWDTRKSGRPDMMALVENICRTNNCEVVFVTSNPKGTAEVVRGCRQRGIPCLGPVWDS